MVAEVSHGNGDLDQDELPAKQPEGSLAKFFSGNFFLVSLKLALALSPLLATTIVLVYSIKYALPIVDSVEAVKDVIIYLAFVAILLCLFLIVFLLSPAYLLWTKKSIDQYYFNYQPYYNKNFLSFLFDLNWRSLSLGGILLYIIHIFAPWWINLQEDKILGYIFSISTVFYIVLFLLQVWVLIKFYNRHKQPISDKTKGNFSLEKYRSFRIANGILSVFWTFVVYLIWFHFVPKDKILIAFFALFAPLLITISYNLILELSYKTTSFLFFPIIIFFIIFIFPGVGELSRMVFHGLGLGGEKTVEIALLPGNQLGLLEGVIRQSGPSGSIYGETLGPFRLILYGKDRIYLSTMTDQECLPERAGSAPANASCQRIFSIRTKYVASVDTTRSPDKRARNTPNTPR